MDDDKAGQRLVLMNVMRLSGALFVALGLYIALGNRNLSPWLGYVLIGFGLFEFFVMPKYLASRWRSPKQ